MTDLFAEAQDLTTQKLRDELASLRRYNRQHVQRITELEASLAKYTVADPSQLVIPKWAKKPKKSDRAHHATPLLLLSDLHLDEVVNPAEMNGANAYNRVIAEQRLLTVVESTIDVCTNYVAGVTFDGIVVAILGDILTGDIHEELARTNEAPVMSSVVHWVPLIAAALKRLADHFGHVFVPCVDGNHDRFYAKMSAKQRAESSVAWVIYSWVSSLLADDPRIEFKITPAPEQVIEIYSTRFLLSHGDGFRSAGGVGGIYPSMLRFLGNKHVQFSAMDLDWDVALMGHWHQYNPGPGFIVNGSLKGYDEYAAKFGFRPEPPRQSLSIITPERGIAFQMPIYAED